MSELFEESRFLDLDKKDLKTDPFEQFQIWFKLANEKVNLYPEQMVLSSINNEGFPESRIVLLRGFKPPYFQFFTNYNSHKAEQLLKTPKASILFFWKELGKQIRVLGTVQKCNDIDSDNYWQTRPRESQIHAWASKQSAPLNSLDELLNEVARLEEKFKDQNIPRPENWGGFQLKATHFEFWQEGKYRLHHRFVYELQSNASWLIQRLNP